MAGSSRIAEAASEHAGPSRVAEDASEHAGPGRAAEAACEPIAGPSRVAEAAIEHAGPSCVAEAWEQLVEISLGKVPEVVQGAERLFKLRAGVRVAASFCAQSPHLETTSSSDGHCS